ncbi:beta-glucosidase [Catenibacillus scindens]|uniref:beta-glucosidase n=2 Tax=Catenibacillus scindens TaxID=673271 RepID=A0A7W8HAC9_9FIRM|nr:glycoside hydrolase family 3 N-terminal domain-containing protein [Catenibacillus scindens]MBB5264615.1 beta-glucosidase [Catenibacillus scindens]
MYRLTDEQKQKVKTLIAQMTLEEKLGQLNLISPSIVGGFDLPFPELVKMFDEGKISFEDFGKIINSADRDYQEDDIRAGRVGGEMLHDPEIANELQRIAVEESRLGIPLLIGLDVIHGFRSVYPIAIAEAGAFDPDLFERTAGMAAKESRTQGVNWHFAPMIDVAHDPRWGRVCEGPGEDPYLASQFARAKVRGLQGDLSCVDNYVAACPKHYVAYGACESGRDYNTVSMSASMLFNTYMPPFKAAAEEGAASVMSAFNDLNGVPCTVNKYTLREILKNRFGFKGFVVSDANAVRECVDHGIAEDDMEAGIQAVNAGLDMDMGTGIFLKYLAGAVADGRVSLDVIDEAVERILSVKVWLGLFEHPYVSKEAMSRYDILPEEHKALTREAGQKSIVLLKNEGNILPLKKGQKISLVGNLADMKEEIIGAWGMNWEKKDCVSILDGLRNAGANISYYPCGGPEGDLNENEISKALEDGDVIVAVLGELVAMSGEAASKTDITLPGKQRDLLQKLLKGNKPVVTVLMNGRPLALGWENENLPVIVEAWHLGIQMGNAVADVLFGEYNPTGRLSVSFPYVTGQCPIYYNHPNTGRPGSSSKFSSRYLDAPFEALYPFGYGLSYTTYVYSDLKIDDKGDFIDVSVNVENTGKYPGVETVQMYMQDVAASLVRPVRELKGFSKVSLDPGERKNVAIKLYKSDMGFYDNHGKYCLEDGKFNIYVGANSRECICQEIVVKF